MYIEGTTCKSIQGGVAVAVARLYPTTPARSNRYNKFARLDVTHKSIFPGQFTDAHETASCPTYLPPDWVARVQPEGQLYFYNTRTHIVTEANIYDSAVLRQISAFAEIAIDAASARGFKLSEYIELFLQPDEANDNECGYYFIDHATRTEFWLDEISSEDVGFPASTSAAQLQWGFREHYWTHVEYFPMHNGIITAQSINELIGILQHARGDHLTSSVGTFPYNAKQCKEFIEILRDHVGYPSDPLDGNILCFVARIWTQVARHRFLNFYGEINARLSRDQHMIELPPSECPRALKPIVKLLFNLPTTYVSELEKLWVDNLVYADPIKEFQIKCLKEWNESTAGNFAMLILHLLLSSSAIGSPSVGLASLGISATGLLSGMILSHYHRMPLHFDTSDAADYLSQSNHPVLGFHPLSIAYSVPKALMSYSAGMVIVQIGLAVYTAVMMTNDRYAVALAGVMVFLAALTLLSLCLIMRRSYSTAGWAGDYESSPPSWWRKLLPYRPFDRKKVDDVEDSADV